MGKLNNQCECGQPMNQTRDLFGMCELSITTIVSLLANEFDVQSQLAWQVSLVAVNPIYVFHEVLDSCKNLKIH